VINGLGDRSPEVWDVLWEYFFRRMLNNLLATSQIFRGLSSEERAEVASHFKQQEFLANDYVTREGEVNDHLFLVLTGEVVVERDLGGIRQTLAELREGEFLGIASTLAQEPYPADVRAVRDTVLLGLSGDAFRQLVDNHTQVAREVQKEMRKRRSLNSQFSSGITTYAELGITRED
jgi:CRP-like cAMP-binding protein